MMNILPLYFTGPPPTLPPVTPTSTIPTPTKPPGCFYNDQDYAVGEVIRVERGSTGIICSKTTCDMDGQISVSDNFNCEPTTTIPEPPTPITV